MGTKPQHKRLKDMQLGISFYDLLLVIAVFVYIFFWSIIDILQLYSLKDGVFDSGIISLTMNSIIFEHTVKYIQYMIGFSLLRIIFSPLILIDGITGMLVIQEIFLALPAIVIYKIFNLKRNDQLSGLLLALSYLLYFPLAGINYFDFHFQSFFILFFLLGIYFLMKKQYLYSSIFLFLSGTVRYPYFIFPLILMCLLLGIQMFNLRFRNRGLDKKEFQYYTANFFLFTFMFIISYFLIFTSPYELAQSSYFSGYFHITSASILKIFLENIDNKVITVVLILAPLLFIPLRSKKWLIFLIPFLGLCFFNNYGPYVYPGAFHFQYMAAVVPFVFLGLIETVHLKETHEQDQKGSKQLIAFIKVLKRKFQARKEPIAVFVAIVLFAVVFQPYSPINAYASDPFPMNILHPNVSVYEEYKDIVNLIPDNNPYVIYQGNLPYVDVHDHALSCVAAFQTAYGFNSGLTYNLYNLTVTHTVDYALGYTCNFAEGPQLTMCQAMNKLYATGNYGIEAYESGFILLARSYSENPIYYQPSVLNEIVGLKNGTHNLTQVSSAYTMLIPGTYNITINSAFNSSFHNIPLIELESDHYKQNYSNISVSPLRDGNNYTINLSLHISFFMYKPILTFSIPAGDSENNATVFLDGPTNL